MTKNISGVVASDGMNLPRKKKKNSKEDSVKYTGQKKLIQDGLGYVVVRPCEAIIREYGNPPYTENTQQLTKKLY